MMTHCHRSYEMKKIKLKLNKVGLGGYPKGSTILVNPNDPYWRRRIAECKGTDYIEILPEVVDKPKVATPKSKANKQES